MNCCYEYGGCGVEFCFMIFDVVEFFGVQVEVKVCFGYYLVIQVQCCFGCDYVVVVVGDVGKGVIVYECGCVFLGLCQVWVQYVLYQCEYGFYYVQLFCDDWFFVFGYCDDGLFELDLQVFCVFGQIQYGYDFGGCCDVEV